MNYKLFLAIWLCTLILVLQAFQFIRTVEKDIMAITESTFNFITNFEGKRNKAYQDSKGLWTIGVGHLIKADEEFLKTITLTDHDVEELFKRDLKWCSEDIDNAVRVPLNQNQYDALYSLCFNIGETNFKKSEVVQNLNQSNYQKAANAFLNWSNPPVLKPRRETEKKLFLTPI
jgi:lysozyme